MTKLAINKFSVTELTLPCGTTLTVRVTGRRDSDDCCYDDECECSDCEHDAHIILVDLGGDEYRIPSDAAVAVADTLAAAAKEAASMNQAAKKKNLKK